MQPVNQPNFVPSAWARLRGMRRRSQALIASVTALVFLCSCCGGLAAWGSTLPSATNTTAINQQNQHPAATATPATTKATPAPDKMPAMKTTVVPTATAQATVTAAPHPTQVVHPPTATPRPHPPTATPAPKYLPIAGNPWDYTLVNTGHILYQPNAAVCDYLTCIASFWDHTNGYVDECQDGEFSHSGGIQGACSHHGGENQPVYQP
jgi:hypothetical protein